MKLKREINLAEAILYGIGILVGAGIYSLIGLGAGAAGNLLWLSFLIAAFVAICTVFSYAELSTFISKDAAEYHYTKKAFSNELFSFVIGFLIIIGTIASVAVLAIAFSDYFSSFFGGSSQIIALTLILIMSVINYCGIKYSSVFHSVSSFLAVFGLLLLVLFGFIINPPPLSVHPNFFHVPSQGFFGAFGAVSLIFFAYVGFEKLANLVEEVKHPKNTLPKALIISLAISTILYILVTLAALNIATPTELAGTSAPLALVALRTLGPFSFIISLSALFAIGSSCMAFLLAGSRMIYGMSESGALPKHFLSLNNSGTPKFPVILVALGSLIAIFFLNLKTAAELSNLSIFLAYLCVNISLIVLAKSKIKRSFVSPRVFGIPIFAYLGVFSCLFLLQFFQLANWYIEGAIALLGLVCYLLFKIRK